MLQSLALSAAIPIVLIPPAALGVVSLAAVIVTHEVAEVLVIATGVRAGRMSARDRVQTTCTEDHPRRGDRAYPGGV
ncbi:MAG: ctpG [Klenkia sp.]|nr:ctpG [Klenkia sp.]